MARLWSDIRAHRLAEADPQSWDDYIYAVHGRNPAVSRVALRGLIGAPTPEKPSRKILDAVRWAVWERDNFTCQHCGKRRFLTIDHIYPYVRGGPTDIDNLQTLCKHCNSRKGKRVG